MNRRMLFMLPVACTTAPIEVVHNIVNIGQSNDLGVDAAVPIPAAYPPVRFFLRRLGGSTYYQTSQDLWVDTTDHTHGSEITLCKNLDLNGITNVMMKAPKGDTSMDQWMPGQPTNDLLVEALQLWLPQLATLFPGASIIHHLIVNQGEEEARNPSPLPAQMWESRFTAVVQGDVNGPGIEDIVGQTLRPHICLTPPITGMTYLSDLNTSQTNAATSLNGFLVDQTGLAQNPDGVHLTSESQYILGYPRQYDSLQLEINP